jgi:hypothetical protein
MLSANPEDEYVTLVAFRRAQSRINVTKLVIEGKKIRKSISHGKRSPFRTSLNLWICRRRRITGIAGRG